MNIQIFGTTICFETKKAQRYFKERGVKCQFIDIKEKGMSKDSDCQKWETCNCGISAGSLAELELVWHK